MYIWVIILVIIFSILALYYTYFFQNKQKYNVEVYPNVLTSEECEQIIELSKQNGLSQSHIVTDDSLSGYDNNFRKSDQTWIPALSHPALQKLSELSVKLTQLPSENQEMVQIVRYEKGGKFDAHFDPCVKGESICKQMNRDAGQRRSTLLVYLNDVSDGGETEFVNIGVKVKPEKGKAILFWSTDENENVIPESKHRGNELKSGEKWIATIWSHSRKY